MMRWKIYYKFKAMFVKTHLKNFLKLFIRLPSACLLVDSETIDTDKHFSTFEGLNEHVQEYNFELCLDLCLNEVEFNLCQFSDDLRRVYVKSILHELYSTSLYFNIPEITPKSIQEKNTDKVFSLIQNQDSYKSFSLSQSYILNCDNTFRHFGVYLDGKLYPFDIDLQKIQKEIGIIVFPTRDWDYLSDLGVKRKPSNDESLSEFINSAIHAGLTSDLSTKTFDRQSHHSISTTSVIITGEQKLKLSLSNYGFLTLPKVKDKDIDMIVKLLNQNDLPYQIAFLDFLDFFKYLQSQYFKTKEKLYYGLKQILGSEARTIKGNILVLNDISKEDRNRYTAHQHKEKVLNDYSLLN